MFCIKNRYMLNDVYTLRILLTLIFKIKKHLLFFLCSWFDNVSSSMCRQKYNIAIIFSKFEHTVTKDNYNYELNNYTV